MADKLYNEASIQAIADAIRAKSGKADTMKVSEMAGEIAELGSYTAVDFFDYTKPEGAIVFEQTTLPADSLYFAKRSNITSIFGVNYNETANRNNTFRGMTGLRYAVFPKWTRMYNTVFFECTNLEAIDWLGGGTGGSLMWGFCYKLKKMVIRKSGGISALGSTNAFNSTPFANGGSGGTIYIPKVLYDELGTGSSLDYKAATNWSTYDAYGTITWAQIEGSIYETQYVDGTPIETGGDS